MDKNEYNLKLEEIDKYVNQENYSEAARVADTIDWRRVRNVRTLCMISEIYEADNRYEDSKAILLRAYRRSPMGRTILYRLVEVTIQLKQYDEAIEYYSEYVQAAPHDTSRYILKYKIYRGRGSSLDEQIDILREYLDHEYSEKWAYELAKLYQQADRIPECLTTCDDLVLWFHSGKYVNKALELKRKYAPLTPKQQQIYNHRFDEEEDETVGLEKQIVGTSEDGLAETIMADVQKEIADSLSEEKPGDTEGVADRLPDEHADSRSGDEKAYVSRKAAPAKEAAEAIASEEVSGREASVSEEVPEVETSVSEEVSEREDPVLEDMPEREAASEEVSGKETAVPEDASAKGAEEASVGEPDDEALTEGANPGRETETKEETPGAPAVRPVRANVNNIRSLHEEMVKNMREIVAGVGRRGTEAEEDELAADRVIERSKEEQISQDAAGQKLPRVEIPKAQPAGTAGKLSIDDILLSMGERGNEVRELAAQAAASAKPAPASGVVSAFDEALLNLEKSADEIAGEAEETKDAAAPQKEPREAGGDWSVLSEDTREELKEELEILAEETERELQKETDFEVQEEDRRKAPDFEEQGESRKEKTDFKETDYFDGQETGRREEPDFEVQEDVQSAAKTDEDEPEEVELLIEDESEEKKPKMSEEEIITAKTRRIRSDEIAEIRAARNADWLQGEDVHYPGEPLEEEEEDQTDHRSSRREEEPALAQDENDQPEAAYSSGPRLKEEQREMFAGFVGIQNMEQQIAAAIEQAGQKGTDRTSRSGNILIFGGHGCGKTTIATNIAKAIAQDRGSQYLKMAKIYAADFNRKDIAATIAKIAGGILIIEEAGDLEDNVVDQLTTAMEFRTDGLVIILEDEQKYIHDLLMRHPRFTMKFTAQIYIPVFTNDELVRFGQIYAEDQDYVLSDSASAALYNRISGVSTQGDVVSITNVKELVDRAITRSNKFFRKLTSGKKRYDENNCIILQEKDFK